MSKEIFASTHNSLFVFLSLTKNFKKRKKKIFHEHIFKVKWRKNYFLKMSISDGTDFGSTAVEKWGSNKKKSSFFNKK